MGTIKTKNRRRSGKKDDEYYTKYDDVKKIVQSVDVEYFRGKVVYLPCDEHGVSNFWNYFYDNFDSLKLKKLIATYKTRDGSNSIKAEMTKSGLSLHKLDDDGGIERDRTVELLEADLVVTNPPFSITKMFYNNIVLKVESAIFLMSPMSLSLSEPSVISEFRKGELRVQNGPSKFVGESGEEKVINTAVCFRGGIVDYLKPKEKIVKPPCVYLPDTEHDAFPVVHNVLDDEVDNRAIFVNSFAETPINFTGIALVPLTSLYNLDTDEFEIIQDKEVRKIKIDNKEKFSRIAVRRKNPISVPIVSLGDND